MSDETRNEGEQSEAIKVHLDTTKDYVIRRFSGTEYTVKGQLIISKHTQNLVNLIVHPETTAPKDFHEAMWPRFDVSEHTTGKRVAYGKRGEDALSVAIEAIKAIQQLVSDMGGADAFHERLAYQAKTNEPIPFEEVFPY